MDKVSANRSYHQLERIIKGVSNHRRIEILELLKNKPELSVADVADTLHVNVKTISEHIRRLAIAGFVLKRSDGNNVRHKLTERGMAMLKFLRILE